VTAGFGVLGFLVVELLLGFLVAVDDGVEATGFVDGVIAF